MGCSVLYEAVENRLGSVFESYGKLVGRYPVAFIISALVICGGLGAGILLMESENDLETLYLPENSQAALDQDRVSDIFSKGIQNNYWSHTLANVPYNADVLIRAKNGKNVLSEDILEEIGHIISKIRNFNVTKDNTNFTYSDVCGKQVRTCVIDGEMLLEKKFLNRYRKNKMTFPDWQVTEHRVIDLNRFLGKADAINGTLQSAKMFRLLFELAQSNATETERSRAWEIGIMNYLPELQTSLNLTEFAYSTSQSLNVELNRNTKKDIRNFSYSFTLMLIYATFTSSGGNCVANRGHLARAAVVAVGLSILASFGTLSLIGLKFVNIVGVMPFLVIGVGVDYSFIMMSGWAETYICKKNSIEERIGLMFRSSGISVTIAAMTDVIAFAVGAMSDFMSVRHFCIYTGLALLFCYLCHMTFFAGCLVIHARRVHANRHCVTCQIRPTADQMRKDGANPVAVWCCSGFPPRVREEDESGCEILPRMVFTRFLLKPVVKVIVIISFMVYFGFAIWGVINLEQGLILNNLVSKDSYYQNYSNWFKNNYQTSFPVSVVFEDEMDYSQAGVSKNIHQLISNLTEIDFVKKNHTLCWLTSYQESGRFFYNENYTPQEFVEGLQTFLMFYTPFKNDIVFNDAKDAILKSRCYVFSSDVPGSSDQGKLMSDLRGTAERSPLSSFVYSPYFMYFEQYNAIIPNTVQMVGAALGAMFLITVLLMPHPLMVFLVIVNLVMILTGIFGFMHYWNLTLSSITMIHLIMSVGFSVDYSVHICHGYLTSSGSNRNARTSSTIAKASSPIWNAGLSSLIGISTLALSDSYVFESFFKVMVLVIAFGILHAALLLPVVLSIIGPVTTEAFADQLPVYPKKQASKTSNGLDNPAFQNTKIPEGE
ncbi:patched domain-containing protein 3 [Patella vulgata]|uniref:patched domain-containing protein 3 n=1 Tax=Patella vulgata TaxID=6465 RepID=UPI00217FFACA|nr:patched domain-containing protein 3 [Patella vulgata]